MRLDKPLSRRIQNKSNRRFKNPTPEPLTEVVLGSWKFTTNEAGDLIVEHTETGEHTIIARIGE